MKQGLSLAGLIWAAMSSSQVQADQTAIQTCYHPMVLPNILQNLDSTDQRIRIYSDHAALQDSQHAVFSGNVQILHKDTLLQAPNARYSPEQQSLVADGGIEYFSNELYVSSRFFNANLATNQATLGQAQYQFVAQAGRGEASSLLASERALTLENALFTACPEQDTSWALHASTIKIPADSGWGEAYHAVFKIKDIPVFYLPYLTFPVDEQRKTGVLIPKIGSSQRRGIDLEVPYYINLAENYDLTLSPRYMSKRGTQLKSQFRYLTEQHQGVMQLEYLPNDSEKPSGFGSRYLGHLNHRSDFTERWRGYIDFTDVSDSTYLTDLGSDYNNQSDTQLYREASLSYFGDHVNSHLKVQGFEILGNYNQAYQALPQLSLASAKPIDLGNVLQASWYSQYAHFRNEQAFYHTTDRVHVEPTLRLPFITPAFEMTAETSLLYTYYQQQSLSMLTAEQADITRTIPKVRLHARVNLEREYDWFGEQALQTFEPQVQYLYIPYRDQSEIGLYDTTRLQDDYYGLFRQNRFSGLDRVNEANQLTLGWTTRFYDNTENELFRFSLGQIFFLKEPELTDDLLTQDLTSTESMLASEMIWHWYRRWYVSSALQYDIDSKKLIKSSASLDYRGDENTLVQLNHRYSRAVSGVEIQQLGLIGAVPLQQNWQLIASYYRDVTNHRMIDANIGLQYESCCWAVRFVARRQVRADLDVAISNVEQLARLDSGFSLQFVFKGFGDKAGFGVSDMLSNGIFSYRRPYLLTN
ncbi:LPS assembly protein LptD [Alishewanella tabrizica]|uniref:LPS-assembly protein LptD n=1 Tax=Alishewanella tabrizica TaxID=671278 RepID=A0ABQ2WHY5_9ALTE|nr:LPS assembly protein LptD [Alishewanella tabrizica]GGW55819.1 LPS-assembly protein LptD [Alishewanella tabrizica]